MTIWAIILLLCCFYITVQQPGGGGWKFASANNLPNNHGNLVQMQQNGAQVWHTFQKNIFCTLSLQLAKKSFNKFTTTVSNLHALK